jgi:hypothetical protein
VADDVTPETLWHWTCHHAAADIARSGLLVPHPQPAHPLPPVVWLTDVGPGEVPPPGPAREALFYSLGLQSEYLACDRTETCWRADGPFPPGVVRFLDLRDAACRSGAGRTWWSMLTMGRAPGRWWVSTVPLPVTLQT